MLATYHNGSTPEEIAVQYPVLCLGEIYAAIAYYLTHRQEIDNYLEQRRKKAQQQRNQFVQQYNLANLRQRLRDRFPTVGRHRSFSQGGEIAVRHKLN